MPSTVTVRTIVVKSRIFSCYLHCVVCSSCPDEVVWNEDKEDEEDEEEEEELDGEDQDEEDDDVSGEEDNNEDEDEDEEEDEVDGESEGEWVSVSDGDEDDDADSDGDSEDEEGDEEGDPAPRVQRSKDPSVVRGRIDARRMLTDADFSLLEKLRAAQATRSLDPRHRSKKSAQLVDSSAALKRKRDEDEENDQDAVLVDYAVEPGSLAPSSRAEKSSKIDRIMHMLDGRKEKRFEHEGHKGGLTDKEKLRLKNFVMVRKGKRSVSSKIRKSNSQTRHDKRESVSDIGWPTFWLFIPSTIICFPFAFYCRERSWAETRESAEEHKKTVLGEFYACVASAVFTFCYLVVI